MAIPYKIRLRILMYPLFFQKGLYYEIIINFTNC
nr:MAG TPA: hypothetical protein [Caudoviricetes sp.]